MGGGISLKSGRQFVMKGFMEFVREQGVVGLGLDKLDKKK
jgi:hypothetical protein